MLAEIAEPSALLSESAMSSACSGTTIFSLPVSTMQLETAISDKTHWQTQPGIGLQGRKPAKKKPLLAARLQHEGSAEICMGRIGNFQSTINFQSTWPAISVLVTHGI